jgi:hypothetical protein
MIIIILSDVGYGERALIVVSVIYAGDFLPVRGPSLLANHLQKQEA